MLFEKGKIFRQMQVFGSASREDLEIDSILQQTRVFDQFEELVLTVCLLANLLQVLSESRFALLAKNCPQELNERFTEED